MLRYALRRLAVAVPTLLAIITLSFALERLAPGGPFDQEQTLTPAVRANLDRLYGLDRPLLVQYGRYLMKRINAERRSLRISRTRCGR